MGKQNIPLNKQIETCQRRIEGHLNNPNSNPERFFRLLMRLSELEKMKPREKKAGTRRRPRRNKEESTE